MSNDTLYGQGLREDSSTLSGYVGSPGTKYKIYEIPFSKMMQPRLGATWAYDGRNTVFVSYAKYNPAASSLPRAASWDRNAATTINVYFDANGNLFGTDNVASSSGKLFVPDMTPRTIKEFLYGTARQFGDRWTGRLYGRYRSGSHFWEDTNNTARQAFNPPPGIPRDLYIPDLAAKLAQIGKQPVEPMSSPISTPRSRSTTRRRSRASTTAGARSSAGRTRGATTTATSTRTGGCRPMTRTSSSGRRISVTAAAASCGT